MQGRPVFSAEFGQTGLCAGTVNQYLRTLSHTQHCGPGVGLARGKPTTPGAVPAGAARPGAIRDRAGLGRDASTCQDHSPGYTTGVDRLTGYGSRASATPGTVPSSKPRLQSFAVTTCGIRRRVIGNERRELRRDRRGARTSDAQHGAALCASLKGHTHSVLDRMTSAIFR